MLPQLNDTEARLIGCLMEKSVTTPQQMPLTLNALTAAANQKSAREPVMALTPGEVQRTARALGERSLVHVEEKIKNGVEKYRQRICGTGGYGDINLTPAQFAIVTLLLLRGAQTPGEIRSRAGRLHDFADNAAVAAAARELMDEDNAENALLVQLPRRKGRKEAEIMHQLCGPIDVAAYAPIASVANSTAAKEQVAALQQRVEELEADNAALRRELDDLRGA